MKFRFAVAAVATFAVGLVSAQTPGPVPASPAAAAAPATVAIPPAPKPAVSKSWVLMDYATGQVLAGENEHVRVAPASITKVMTSYVIAAELKLGKIKRDDQVMLSERAWREGGAGTDGSYSGFPVNQTARLEDMEKGMAIQSGNDAAIALAEHAAGSEEAFASLMNNYAAKLGMTGSHFVNAHGLSAEGHYTTAYDLALLGRAMVRDYPETYAYNKIREFKVGDITQQNRNLLLWRDPSVDGIKTGHTSEAGYCLLSSAQRGDQRLIAVVMGDSSEKQRAEDSLALLNWGFRFYETHRLYEPGKQVAQQRVWKGTEKEVLLGVAQPLLVGVPRGRYNELKPSIDVPKTLEAPIKQGQAIGTVKVSLDGKVIAQAPLVALKAVEEAGFFKRLWDSFWMWWEAE
ncbi:D-alanyl-D-alanine carboxypeptidase family protein [Xanthomonas graminis]|jgi:D-alanyl-D-alanine carboxypeptidase (penicillin-binding protein 5/6)|uniref:serine-type D-Ala-D-Ala carboxypeptidase n=1 Tax=Xanthomonas graminis pv. graminis TaxID=134874 RepID=A0A1M4JKY5_9XANT|nr:D-alanyl-D-alanine carboxypeptidase family protein [Xanthomonas translucens]EKU24224.1 exported serine-type D-Ala-D-Ala carboxypeptidase [Xanthomonas translucens pv. graminis ART-Xtg29]OAX61723.1 D-alanyl-D-alanine carboxypeptidase [Xanthomonas translucens pv. graminis]UKE55018.1 D-alanyl-D-alanine carboxypeptidase [Xanthomonas translucens pv. graminis]WIH08316.1 D-alanyl-D-alanine carboxypeptidase [Xanthomonas translucens pv. graminis]WIH12695.1 D-alanyl-D-alanine carboxypeptidase [Xanthom